MKHQICITSKHEDLSDKDVRAQIRHIKEMYREDIDKGELEFSSCHMPASVPEASTFFSRIFEEELGGCYSPMLKDCKSMEECREALTEARRELAEESSCLHIIGRVLSDGIIEEIRLFELSCSEEHIVFQTGRHGVVTLIKIN